MNLLTPAKSARAGAYRDHWTPECFTPEDEETFASVTWQIARHKTDEELDLTEWGVHHSRLNRAHHTESAPPSVALDPVEAGLRVIAPEVARFHAYYMAAVEAGIADFRREFEARLSRLEAAVAERTSTENRGAMLLDTAIAQLRAKLGEEAEPPSLEEEMELWKLVDFSISADEE